MTHWFVFSFAGIENEKILLFLISKPYWGLGWAYNLWLLSWVLVHTPGKSTGSPGNTFSHFSLSETLQDTICCVGVVIGITNMPPLLNDLLPSAFNTSWEDLLGSYFIETQASHLAGICGKKDCVERGMHMLCALPWGNPFSILTSLDLSSLWSHNCARHLDIFLVSRMSQILHSVILTPFFWTNTWFQCDHE